MRESERKGGKRKKKKMLFSIVWFEREQGRKRKLPKEENVFSFSFTLNQTKKNVFIFPFL